MKRREPKKCISFTLPRIDEVAYVIEDPLKDANAGTGKKRKTLERLQIRAEQ